MEVMNYEVIASGDTRPIGFPAAHRSASLSDGGLDSQEMLARLASKRSISFLVIYATEKAGAVPRALIYALAALNKAPRLAAVAAQTIQPRARSWREERWR
jgi:hypothetical protein